MNLPQTTYNDVPGVAKLGMVDQCADEDKLSRIASGALPFGVFVLADAAAGATGVSPGTCKAIPDSTASLAACIGVAVFEAARSPYNVPGTAYDSGGGDYAAKDDVAVLHKGRIWMWTEAAATEGNPVYVRCTAAAGKPNGQVTDGVTTNFVKHPTAVFAGSTSGAGLVLVEVK